MEMITDMYTHQMIVCLAAACTLTSLAGRSFVCSTTWLSSFTFTFSHHDSRSVALRK